MIVFNEELKISQFSKDHVESNLESLIEFTIIAAKDPEEDKPEESNGRRLQEELLQEKAIDFISLEHLDKGAMIFNIQFVNPFAITPPGSSQKDLLEVRFVNETITLDNGKVTTTLQEYFSSLETKLTIEDSNLVMTFPIPG
jgi:hypothetical protein